jgi:PQQ-like domain
MRAAGAAVGALSILAFVATAALAQTASWRQYQATPEHTGAAEGPAPPYRQAWAYRQRAAAPPSPTASASASPSTTPSSSVGPKPNQQGLSAPVVSVEDELAISVGPTGVVAVDLSSGEGAWSTDREAGPSSAPALAEAGGRDVLVYTQGSSGDDASIMGIDASDGSDAWRRPAPLKAVSRTGVVVEAETAFVGDDRGNVYAFDAASGRSLWSTQLAGRTLAPLTATPDVVVATVAAPTSPETPVVIALNASSGAQMWDAHPNVFAAGATSGVVVDGRFALGLPDRAVHAFDLSDGGEAWSSGAFFSLPSPFGAGAVVDGDVVFVYFGDLAGDVRRLDAATGRLVWDYPLNTAVLRSPPAVSGSDIVIGLRDGSLAAIDAATGDLVFRSPPASGLLGPIAVAPSVLVAVRGGTDAGLVAFEHDASGAVERVPSPAKLDPARLATGFLAAALVVIAVLLVPSRLLLAREGPAFDAEEEPTPPVDPFDDASGGGPDDAEAG